VGAQLDAEFNFRGFLLRKGWFSPINVPFLGAKGTFPTMIVGERIVGGWFDDNFTAHGFFLRDGDFQSIDCTGQNNLFLSGLNPEGDMVGGTNFANGTEHGVLIRGRPVYSN